METKKQRFVREFDEKILGVRYIVLAIENSNDAVEIVVKSMDLEEEFQFVISSYDSNLRGYSYRSKIINWMIV